MKNQLIEKWSKKYKKSINCNNPKGFSQKAHCAGRKKRNESMIDEIQQDYFQNMDLINRVLDKVSEYEVITKLVSKMNKDQVIDALSQYISEEVQDYINERCQKGYKTHPTRKTKKMFGRTYRNCVKAEGTRRSKRYDPRNYVGRDAGRRFTNSSGGKVPPVGLYGEKKDPAKGTGKKPKGSGRRLYTDENPNDTVSVKFSSVSDIQDTFSKASFKNKSHKRQSQIINLVHQRVRAAYNNAKDPETKARLKKAFDYAKKRKEASKEKTKRMKK